PLAARRGVVRGVQARASTDGPPATPAAAPAATPTPAPAAPASSGSRPNEADCARYSAEAARPYLEYARARAGPQQRLQRALWGRVPLLQRLRSGRPAGRQRRGARHAAVDLACRLPGLARRRPAQPLPERGARVAPALRPDLSRRPAEPGDREPHRAGRHAAV